jgi:hypothetical protein
MNSQKANTIIKKWLVGGYIDKLTYYITGWELSFINTNYQVFSVFSEIEVIKPKGWNKLIDNSPLNITNSNEFEDTITSIVLFTALNKHSIVSTEIDAKNNLFIEFKNESRIRIPSKVENDDWTWNVQEKCGERIKCVCGEILYENKKANT